MTSISLPKIHLIYRVCDTVMSCTSTKRDFNFTKTQLVAGCLATLKQAISISNVDMTIDIVVDSCSDKIIKLLQFENVKTTIYHQDYHSNPLSFCKCLDIALQYPEEDIVMFLEDDYYVLDYLMFEKIAYVLQNTEIDAIFTDDYPEKYSDQNNSYTTQVFQTKVGNFVQTDESTCSFATKVKLLKAYKSSFMKFIDFPQVDEYHSIDIAWREKTLCSPTPGYTLHVQLDRFIPPYIDKKEIELSLKIHADAAII